MFFCVGGEEGGGGKKKKKGGGGGGRCVCTWTEKRARRKHSPGETLASQEVLFMIVQEGLASLTLVMW